MKYSVLHFRKVLFLLIITFLIFSPAFADKISYTYDDMGRLTKADYGTTAITYSYDSAGNILEVITGPDLGCPLSLALEKQEHINRLRNFKDRRLSTAAQKDLVSLYYRHAMEVSLILLAHPPLKERVQECVVNNLTIFDKLTLEETVWLDQEMVDEARALLSDLEKAGSPTLRDDMRYLIQGLEKGFLLDELGIRVE